MKEQSAAAPALSIGLPVYNGEKFLAEALDCLLAQSFGDFELLICDNASTDRTAEIAAAYACRDPRIRYHRNSSNIGAAANFRTAFHLTQAPLFKWAAHDDLYEPNYLASCMEILRCRVDVVLAHSATAFIDDAGRPFPFDAKTGRYLDPLTGIPQTPDDSALGDDDHPVRRFWHVLSRARWGSHIFGVMRREALEQTRLLADFASSDRAALAELALLGRFKANPARLYLKRFHATGSWALSHKELKSFLGEAKRYSRRYRQLEAFLSGPLNKPVDLATKAICEGLVVAHCGRTLADIARRKDANIEKQGRAWRLHAERKSEAEELPQ
jgi:glycosyltransferase involved in cell wall biosynthesis